MNAPPTRAPQDPRARAAMEQVPLDMVPPKPVITLENIFDPETDYEKWMMRLIWTDRERGQKVREEWIAGLPYFDGPADNSDILPPGAPPPNVPLHWLRVPIHFTPLPDPRYTRSVYIAKNYFTFTRIEPAQELFARIYGGSRPRRILDFGTGLGTSAMALARLFPQAEVIGIDLAPHFVRFARKWAERERIPNVTFYLQHAGETVFADDSFDIVNESYVLHEMPQPEAAKIVHEMRRVLRPGGRASWVDVIYDDTEEERQARVQRARGPEPFLGEYMKLNVEQTVRASGFINVSKLRDPNWDCMVITAVKL
ncbi:MAG: class I SAM-dependent methyltransferase [Chloroflexi bacterium]|nr:class I SAM-dependent methyltransferase [Chloroflexota bacterium]